MTAEESLPGSGGGSRQAILAAAGELFGSRAFARVTIRDIAARAGTSPALVMKCGGSKLELYHATASISPPALPDVPDDRLGAALVRELVDRQRRGDLEHLGRSLMLRLTAPDPDAIRSSFLDAYVGPLTERLRGPGAELRAELAVAALSGLATVLRIFETSAAVADPERVVADYGAVVQRLLDDHPPEDRAADR